MGRSLHPPVGECPEGSLHAAASRVIGGCCCVRSDVPRVVLMEFLQKRIHSANTSHGTDMRGPLDGLFTGRKSVARSHWVD